MCERGGFTFQIICDNRAFDWPFFTPAGYRPWLICRIKSPIPQQTRSWLIFFFCGAQPWLKKAKVVLYLTQNQHQILTKTQSPTLRVIECPTQGDGMRIPERHAQTRAVHMSQCLRAGAYVWRRPTYTYISIYSCLCGNLSWTPPAFTSGIKPRFVCAIQTKATACRLFLDFIASWQLPFLPANAHSSTRRKLKFTYRPQWIHYHTYDPYHSPTSPLRTVLLSCPFPLTAWRSAALVLPPSFVSLCHNCLLCKILLANVCVRLRVGPSGAKYCPHLIPLSVGLSANALVYALFPYAVFIASHWVDDKEGNLLLHDICHPAPVSQMPAAVTTGVQIATDHTWHQHMSLVLTWDDAALRFVCAQWLPVIVYMSPR